MGIKLTWRGCVIIIIVLVMVLIGWYFLIPGGHDAFAKCLTERGAVMYGAEWCSNCKQQKVLFGKSFKYITYVECPQNPGLCKEKGIEGYPTWIIDDASYKGVQELEKLSLITGCQLD